MAEPTFSSMGDDPDDLPRTFRREKEARQREAQEREAKEREAQQRVAAERQAKEQRAAAARPAPVMTPSPGPSLSAAGERAGPQIYADPVVQPAEIADMPYPASVRRFDVPFVHLMTFFLKAVVAAIPALILLITLLWFAGSALQTFFPDLVKMKILISFPN